MCNKIFCSIIIALLSFSVFSSSALSQTQGRDNNGFTPEEYQRLLKVINSVKSDPDKLADFSKFSINKQMLERFDPATQKPTLPSDENGFLERQAVVYTFGTQCLVLGSGLCYERTKWDGGLQCQTCCTDVVACFSHPSLENIWGDVIDCSKGALAAASLAMLLSGSAAAIETYKTTFYICITSKYSWASAIQLSVELRTSCGNWRWCW